MYSGWGGGDPNTACSQTFAYDLWSPDPINTWVRGTAVYDNNTDCDNASCSTPIPWPNWADGGGLYFDVDNTMCQLASGPITCPSDVNLKEEITTIKDALSSVLQLNPVEFDWNELEPSYNAMKRDGKLHSFGFIAQEVRSVLPELIQFRTGGYYGVDYTSINAYLVEAIKEQQVFIDDLDSLITNLEEKVERY
jgi:hypothetical protein